MAISSLGAGSGLDLESLVKEIITAERTPTEARLTLKETATQAKVTAYNNLKSTLSSFQNALSNLKQSSFGSKQTASVSDSALLQATATSSSQTGSYEIDVFEMAKAHKLASAADFANSSAKVGGGTLSFKSGSATFNVTISENDSLAAIRDAVNNTPSNNSVTASLLTVDAGKNDGSTVTRLVFSAKNTGEANAITITATDNDGNNTDNAGLSQLINANLTEITPAQDARIAIDGLTVKSSTNTFTNVVDGVTLQIFKESSELPDPVTSTLTLSNDKSSVKKEIEKFVATYNELASVFNTLTNFNSASNTGGILNGDQTATALESQLRRIMSSTNSDADSDMNSLSALGIKTNRDGTLTLDSDKLNAAIDTNFEKIAELFAGKNGIATKLDKQLSTILGSDGAISSRQEGFQKQLEEITKSRETLTMRLEKLEARYRSQFSALDSLIAQLNTTGDFITQQLEAAMASTKKK